MSFLQPYCHHVVIKRDDLGQPADHKVEAKRIVLPDIVMEQAKMATVLSVGLAVQEVIVPGDRVFVTWRVGTPYEDDTHGKIEILREDELLAYDEGLHEVRYKEYERTIG